MQQSQVSSLITALRSDASPQIKGFLYQFVVALDYCFRLSPGQSLYVEKYGDVAIKEDGTYDEATGAVSIEVKMYADDLDVRHQNLLNTLFNWLEDDFDFESYPQLIIYTTQQIKDNSLLKGWNDKNPENKFKIIRDSYSDYLDKHKSKIADTDPTKHKTIKSNATQMTRVLASVNKTDGSIDEEASKKRLMDLLARVRIIDSCKDFDQAYRELFKYATVTTDNLREHFIQCMLGYIISPTNMQNGWKIDRDSFTEHFRILAKEMQPQSIEFPEAPDVKVDEKEYADALFVSKLKCIEYDRISEAMVNYAKTTGLLTGEFKRPSAEKNLAKYQSNMVDIYQNKYDNAKDDMLLIDDLTDKKIKAKSRIFLRDFLLACTAIRFAPFGVTKKYFSDGMCHYMANDGEQNIKWLLKDE